MALPRPLARSILSHQRIISRYQYQGSRTANLHLNPTLQQRASYSSSGPRITQPSIWRSIIPKFMRESPRTPSLSSHSTSSSKRSQSKEWNPFLVYIVMFILIGSNAINLISVRNDQLNFSQKTDRQIASLKEVIRKIQNGEKVDIEAALGTGDPEREKDWEEALKEIESTDALYNKELRKREQDTTQQAQATKSSAEANGTKMNESVTNKSRTWFY